MSTKLLYLLIPGCILIHSCRPKAKLQDTVLHVVAENDINEWITAEYYGEVLYSYQEAKQDWKYDNARKNVDPTNIPAGVADSVGFGTERVLGFYSELHLALKLLHEGLERKRPRFLKQAFNENFQEIKQSPYFVLIREVVPRGNEKLFLNYVRQNDPIKFERNHWNKFLEKEKQEEGKKEKKDLVYLGRGWVKAGIKLDMEKLTESIKLRKQEDSANNSRKILDIEGITPEILNADINPWFIPGKSPGFEIISWKKQKRFTFEEINRIKTKCKLRLVRDAIERGILMRAKESFEEQLLSFLTIMGIDELDEVNIILPETYEMKYLVGTSFNFGEGPLFTEEDKFVECDELERLTSMAMERGGGSISPYMELLDSLKKENSTQAKIGFVREFEPISTDTITL